jgi:hypothetical protein
MPYLIFDTFRQPGWTQTIVKLVGIVSYTEVLQKILTVEASQAKACRCTELEASNIFI